MKHTHFRSNSASFSYVQFIGYLTRPQRRCLQPKIEFFLSNTPEYRGTRDFISSHLIPQFRETPVENDNYEKEECLGIKKENKHE
jgi:hypothetical protein